jgi:membrane protease YdiL (CAAX protease family)
LLVLANLLNNRLLPRAYQLTGVVTSVVLLAVARRDGCSWADLGLRPRHVSSGLRWGAAASGLVLLGYALGASLPPTRAGFIDDRVAGLSGTDVARRSLVRVPLGTVLLEEVAFRGVLYAMLGRRYGVRGAVGLPSLIFGLWHVLPAHEVRDSNAAVAGLVGNGSTGRMMSVVAAVAGTAAGGVVLSELRRRSGSLLAPTAVHWALNGLGYAFAWAVSGRR